MVIGIETVRTLPLCAVNLTQRDGGLNHPDDSFGHTILKIENFGDFAFITICPRVAAFRSIKKLSGNSKAISALSDATCQDVANTQHTANLADISRLALERETRISSDHKEGSNPRKGGSYLLNNSIREILLLRVATHVRERQDGDGGLVGQRKRLGFARARSDGYGESYRIRPHRLVNVFDRLL